MENQNDPNIYFQKVPPHDSEAEKAVLSSMFMDKDAVGIAIENLTPDDFYNPDNKMVFDAAVELYHSGKPIDIITVKSKLEEKNIFDQIGGISFLASIATAVGSSVNIKHYSQIVQEKSLLRRLIKTANDVSSMSFDAKESVDFIMEKAEKGIFDVMQNRRTSEFSHIRDITISSFEKIEDIYRNKGKLTGVPTGFIDFDNRTAGLQKSDLILLAARPSMGKTAFALNIAQNAAIRNGVKRTACKPYALL